MVPNLPDLVREAYAALYGNSIMVTTNGVTVQAHMRDGISCLFVQFNNDTDAGRAYTALRLLANAADKLSQVTPSETTPLSDFQEGQWWVKELDALVARHSTPDQQRAVAVVHSLLKSVAASSAIPQAKV